MLDLESDTLTERRRHRRFDLEEETSSARLEEGLRTKLRIVNLSFGGVCLDSDWPLHVDSAYKVRLEPRSLVDDGVSVTVFVQWSRRIGHHWRCGGVFLKSDKGWLGPGEGPEAD